MTWIKIDDQFVDHPKILGLKDEAFRAYISGLCYSSRYLTDGFLPDAALKTICNARSKTTLIEAGLWHHAKGGIMIHDYLDYNPTKAATEIKRAEAANRMKRLRGGK